MTINSVPNPDLTILTDNKPRWNTPDQRRYGFQNLHRISRWVTSVRSDEVLTLTKQIDHRIGDMAEVQALTNSVMFCGMVVVHGQSVLFEKYAPDFGPEQPHTIMSISKTMMHFVIGKLVAEGKIDPSKSVATYLPGIGSGYAEATVQQVLNMDLENNYSEDYSDPYTSSYGHEASIGWRLTDEPYRTQKEFLTGITSDDVTNRTGAANYKSANTDVLAWIAEEVGGRPMMDWVIEIVEAAGLEHAMHMCTDRTGFPIMDGGACMTTRDMARYGLLFTRGGEGVKGRRVGDAAYLEHSCRNPGPKLPEPKDFYNYSNQIYTDGTWVGHGGYGGQFLLANLKTGVVGAFFSILENDHAWDEEYPPRITRMLADVAARFGNV